MSYILVVKCRTFQNFTVVNLVENNGSDLEILYIQ